MSLTSAARKKKGLGGGGGGMERNAQNVAIAIQHHRYTSPLLCLNHFDPIIRTLVAEYNYSLI